MAEPSIPLLAPAGVLRQPIAFIASAGWLVPLGEEQDSLWFRASQLGASLALFFGFGIKQRNQIHRRWGVTVRRLVSGS